MKRHARQACDRHAPWQGCWRALRVLLLCLAACAALPAAWAHKASDAYLVLGPSPAGAAAAGAASQDLTLQLSFALKDLDAALETLDADNDRRLTWAEVQAATPAVVRWVQGGFGLRCGGEALAPVWAFDSLEQRSDGNYLRLKAPVRCAAASALTLDYGLMKDIDPTHRLLVGGSLGGQPIAVVLAPGGRASADLRRAGSTAVQAEGEAQSGLQTFANFFFEGVHHIVTGYDHLAFLLALLLPISLRRRREPQLLAAGADSSPTRPGFNALLLTITGFTVGHSVTLAMASLGLISAPPEWVEPAIAITIGLSALLNLYPVRWIRGDVLALCFGLIHGLGFSGVMIEAGVTGSLLLWALAGFNVGVEAGQLACVLLWCAAHLALVRWSRYEQVVVRGGSTALLLLALYWTVERVAG